MSEIEKGKNVMSYGKVEIGANTTIRDNVILGSSEDGILRIGEDSIIRSGTVIYSGVKIGKKFATGHNVLIRENTVIGDEVLVGSSATIEGECEIGNRVKIQTSTYIPRKTVIESNAFLGPFCVLTNDKYMRYGAELKGPTIKKCAKIGANATILPGVVVGGEAIVGAGAVVTEDVKSGDIVAGNPAKSVKSV